MEDAGTEDVHHIILFGNGEDRRPWHLPSDRFSFINVRDDLKSIGHYHNLGVALATSPWVMKSDVDVLPNVNFFKELLPVLDAAGPREWFNAGFVYLSSDASRALLTDYTVPISEMTYHNVMEDRGLYCMGRYLDPAGSQFVCRKEDYIHFGGCDARFAGWGWEDYQQLYCLEHQALGEDPLPGPLTLGNVTQRCRDEIARPRAKSLWHMSEWLCMFHKWHPKPPEGRYRNMAQSNKNKEVLLDCLLRRRSERG